MKRFFKGLLCFVIMISCCGLFSACTDNFEGKYHFENITVELVSSIRENPSEMQAMLDEYGAKDYDDLIAKVTKEKRKDYEDSQETKYEFIFKSKGYYIFTYKDNKEKGTWKEVEGVFVTESTDSSVVSFPSMFYKGRPGKIYFKDTSTEFTIYFNYSK